MNQMMSQRKCLIAWVVALGILGGGTVFAAPEPNPPKEARLEEKKLEQLSNCEIDDLGKKVLAIAPTKWKHAETENFVYHYRRATEAQRVVREVEYTLWFVASALNADKERYTKKSHVYIFQDEKEWKQFLLDAEFPEWAGSFARGDDLYLSVARAGGAFDSNTLAHEATHVVVSRLYPNQRWPLWMNEGFAEYMGSAAIAARTKQYLKGMQKALHSGDLPLDELFALKRYPQKHEEISQLYQTSERLVRFLMTEFPKERFPSFVEALLGEKSFDEAALAVYSDKVTDAAQLRKKYARFGH